MLNFLPAPLLLLISLSLTIVNTLVGAVVIALLIPLKLMPVKALRILASRLLNQVYFIWVEINRGIFHLVNRVSWQIDGDLEQLSRERWYLVVSNHRSWLDIPVLAIALNRRIPVLKFFLKRELIWVPLVGFCAWALDMPFMRRFTPQQLKQNPELKGKDIESTRRSCAKFRHVPCAVLNFAEGTRFTPHKQQQRQSPYRHLLRPKAGGLALTLAAMGEQFDQVLSISLCYPDNRQGRPMLDLLCGRISRVQLYIEAIATDALPQGDYMDSPQFRSEFQRWLNSVWQRSDQRLEQWAQQEEPSGDSQQDRE